MRHGSLTNALAAVYRLDDTLHAISTAGGVRFEGKRYHEDTGPPFTLVDRPGELQVEETPLGDYAFTTRQLWHRPAAGGVQHALQIEPVEAGHAHVEQDAAGYGAIDTLEKLSRRPEGLALQADGCEQAPHGGPHRAVIVYDEYGR